eukprot:1193044-Prorocentrum_minimum.AAC.4
MGTNSRLLFCNGQGDLSEGWSYDQHKRVRALLSRFVSPNSRGVPQGNQLLSVGRLADHRCRARAGRLRMVGPARVGHSANRLQDPAISPRAGWRIRGRTSIEGAGLQAGLFLPCGVAGPRLMRRRVSTQSAGEAERSPAGKNLQARRVSGRCPEVSNSRPRAARILRGRPEVSNSPLRGSPDLGAAACRNSPSGHPIPRRVAEFPAVSPNSPPCRRIPRRVAEFPAVSPNSPLCRRIPRRVAEFPAVSPNSPPCCPIFPAVSPNCPPCRPIPRCVAQFSPPSDSAPGEAS